MAHIYKTCNDACLFTTLTC